MANVEVAGSKEIWDAEALADGTENSTSSDVFYVTGEKRINLSLKVENTTSAALDTACVITVNTTHDLSKFYLHTTLTCVTTAEAMNTWAGIELPVCTRGVRITATHAGGYSVELSGDITAQRIS